MCGRVWQFRFSEFSDEESLLYSGTVDKVEAVFKLAVTRYIEPQVCRLFHM